MPSVRTPLVHSPYSTVSASNAHIRVLTKPRPTPRTRKQANATAGIEGGNDGDHAAQEVGILLAHGAHELRGGEGGGEDADRLHDAGDDEVVGIAEHVAGVEGGDRPRG